MAHEKQDNSHIDRDWCDPAWVHFPTLPFQLVLEGGAMRGMFSCGVVDFMLDHGLLAESVVGVSMGASCGFSYAAGVTGQTAKAVMAYRSDWRFMSLRSKLVTGDFVGNEFIFDTIPYKLDHIPTWLYRKSPMRLVTVATNVDTGEPDYHELQKNKGHETEARYLMASASLPYVNRFVSVDNKRLLDGGICRSIPFEFGREEYAGRQVIVLTRERGFVPKPEGHLTRVATDLRYANYPQLRRRLMQRSSEYRRELLEVESLHDCGELFAIWAPHELSASLAERNPNRLLATYEQGLKAAAEVWPALLRFLGL